MTTLDPKALEAADQQSIECDRTHCRVDECNGFLCVAAITTYLDALPQPEGDEGLARQASEWFERDWNDGDDASEAAAELIRQMAQALTAKDAEIAELEAERDWLRAENEKLRQLSSGEGDTLDDILDNQAWVMFSHVACFIFGPDTMEDWQDAWAEGEVKKGWFTANRGAAAWIARECSAAIDAERSRAKAAERENERLREALIGIAARSMGGWVKRQARAALTPKEQESET